jgi:hypothetical protein
MTSASSATAPTLSPIWTSLVERSGDVDDSGARGRRDGRTSRRPRWALHNALLMARYALASAELTVGSPAGEAPGARALARALRHLGEGEALIRLVGSLAGVEAHPGAVAYGSPAAHLLGLVHSLRLGLDRLEAAYGGADWSLRLQIRRVVVGSTRRRQPSVMGLLCRAAAELSTVELSTVEPSSVPGGDAEGQCAPIRRPHRAGARPTPPDNLSLRDGEVHRLAGLAAERCAERPHRGSRVRRCRRR